MEHRRTNLTIKKNNKQSLPNQNTTLGKNIFSSENIQQFAYQSDVKNIKKKQDKKIEDQICQKTLLSVPQYKEVTSEIRVLGFKIFKNY